jgi:hypothetical protein
VSTAGTQISARLRRLLITTLQIIVVTAGLAGIAYIGTHSECSGYWEFDEHDTLVCQRVVE